MIGRSLLFAALIFAVIFAAASLESDVAADTSSPEPTVATPEPITGTAVQPAPGSETYVRPPFTPYDVGPPRNDEFTDNSPKPLWAYEDLTPDEQAVADRGRDATRWQPVNDAYARASAEMARKAAAASAQSQLGAENLGAIGVVP